jgi:outer membrane cobalamin receptor
MKLVPFILVLFISEMTQAQYQTTVFGYRERLRVGDRQFKNVPDNLELRQTLNNDPSLQVLGSQKLLDTQTGGFIFGKSEHTLTVLDGIPLNDESSGGGIIDFSSVPVGVVDSVIIRPGAQANAFGSGSLAGVVDYKIAETNSSQVNFAGGSFGYHREKLLIGNSQNYFFAVQSERSQGPSVSLEPENDAATRSSFFGSYKHNWGSRVLKFWLLATDSMSEYDRGTIPLTDDWNAQNTLKSQLASVSLKSADLTLRFDFKNSLRAQEDLPESLTDSYAASGDYKLNWQRAMVSDYLVNAAEHRVQVEISATQTEIGIKETSLFGNTRIQSRDLSVAEFLQYQNQQANRLITVSAKNDCQGSLCAMVGDLRLDINSEPLQFWISAGQGYKFPTVYQRNSIYGDPDLRAERALNLIAGISYQFNEHHLQLKTVQSRYFDLIDYNLSTNKYFNQARVRASHLSLEYLHKNGASSWGIEASYNHIYDEISGWKLIRKPTFKGRLFFTQNFSNDIDASVYLIKIGDREDQISLSQRSDLPGYSYVNSSLSYKISSSQKLDLYIQNIFNNKYEEIFAHRSDEQSFLVNYAINL